MTADSGPMSDPPRVWVIGDDRPGDTTQSIGLAQALGYPFEFKRLQFNRRARFQRIALALLGRVGAGLCGVDRARSDPLGPPWPDIAIGSVWRTAPVVRWIARQSGGRTRTIQLGRKGAESAAAFDAVVTPAYWRLLPHPRRVETVLPLHRVSPAALAAARVEWAGLFDAGPRPHVALLVGGSTGGGFYRLDAPAARDMALAVRAFAEAAGGTVFAIASRRTGAAAEAVLAETLRAPHRVTPWRPDHANPYLGHLALADAIVVTGESESMLAEAAATGKPVYIYDLPHRAPGLAEEVLGAIALRARRHILAGTAPGPWTRAVDRICAWLVGRGVIRPPRDLGDLHGMLVARGVGFPFGAPFTGQAARFDEAAEVASRVRQMLLLPDPSVSGARAEEPSRSETS